MSGSGALSALTVLDLRDNKISDPGMVAFSEAIGKGSLPALKELILSSNEIADPGMISFAEAIGKDPLPKLPFLFVDDTNRIELKAACDARRIILNLDTE